MEHFIIVVLILVIIGLIITNKSFNWTFYKNWRFYQKCKSLPIFDSWTYSCLFKTNYLNEYVMGTIVKKEIKNDRFNSGKLWYFIYVEYQNKGVTKTKKIIVGKKTYDFNWHKEGDTITICI